MSRMLTRTGRNVTVLDWNNTQNGKLIGSMGILSALLQGAYVRRSMSKVGETIVARQGVTSCAVALVLLALLPNSVQTNNWLAMNLLYGAAACLAFTSATVVNALTAYASLQCDEAGFDKVTGKPLEHPQLAKGKALGKFRSSGQLGRAIGPVLGMPRLHCRDHFLLNILFSMRILLDIRPNLHLCGISFSDVCIVGKDAIYREISEILEHYIYQIHLPWILIMLDSNNQLA